MECFINVINYKNMKIDYFKNGYFYISKSKIFFHFNIKYFFAYFNSKYSKK